MTAPFDLSWSPTHWNLAAPLSWPKSARVHVEDLFRQSFEDIAAVFGVMASAPQHTFAISTEHPERMREWFASLPSGGLIWSRLLNGIQQLDTYRPALRRAFESSLDARAGELAWPLPNVWLGVRVTDQRTADERIPALLDTPAAVRFVEVVPRRPIDLTETNYQTNGIPGVPGSFFATCHDALAGEIKSRAPKRDAWNEDDVNDWSVDGAGPRLDWVVVDGTVNVAIAERIVDDCRAAGVPVFVRGDDLPDDVRVRELPQ